MRSRLMALSRRARSSAFARAPLVVAPPPDPDPGEPVEGAIYVSTTGSDSTGDGSWENPYYSMLKVAEVVQPGDTVYLRGGYYDEVGVQVYLTNAYAPGGGDKRVMFSGTAQAPITVRSYPGEWAVFDGINHEAHPRSYQDGWPGEALEPRMIFFVGEHVRWEHLEFRNGVANTFRAIGNWNKFRHLVVSNSHAQGFDMQGSNNEVAYCLFTDTWNAFLDGNTGDGFLLNNTSQLSDNFPGQQYSQFNHIHHCISSRCSDDGFSLAQSRDNLMEHCVSYRSGRDLEGLIETSYSGMGTGFKMGLSFTTETDNVVRYNISIENRGWGFISNTSQGVLFHNNTSYSDDGGLVLTHHETNSCDNTGHNMLVVDYRGGWPRIVGDCSVHTNNVAVNGNDGHSWTGGSDNITVSSDDLLSKVISSPDFMRLGAGSVARGHGIVVHKSSDTDAGAIPYGQQFAGGWKWYQAMQSFPTDRSAWPRPQGAIVAPDLDPE